MSHQNGRTEGNSLLRIVVVGIPFRKTARFWLSDIQAGGIIVCWYMYVKIIW